MTAPQSLHKYTYTHNNPVNATDPTGRMMNTITTFVANTVQAGMRAMKQAATMAAKWYMQAQVYVTTVFYQLRDSLMRFANWTIMQIQQLAQLPAAIYRRVADALSRTINSPPTLEQARRFGHWSHEQVVGAWRAVFQGHFTPNTQIHHLVGQHSANVQRFGHRAIRSMSNTRPIVDTLHSRISGYFSSGAGRVDFLNLPQYQGQGISLVRHYVSTGTWEQQWRFGKALYDHVMLHGTTTGFDPQALGLLW